MVWHLDIEEILDFDGLGYVDERNYGVAFHTADGKKMKILIEFANRYKRDDLVFYEDDKEVYRMKFDDPSDIFDFAEALKYVAGKKENDEINEYAWRSSIR